jgi:predicted CXXCH cytochrome family protein
VQHKAIEQQGCVGCHDPHVSPTKFLLRADSAAALCAKCHVTPMKKHAHEPFASGQCTLCHQPHESTSAGLLRNAPAAVPGLVDNAATPTGVTAHCFSCHTDIQKAAAQLPHVHKASIQNCTTCHGPHATDFPHQLKKSVNDTCLSCHQAVQQQIAKSKVVHGAVAQGCDACHDPHASSQPNELRARMDKVCLTCHATEIKTAAGRTIPGMAAVLASKNLHGPVRAAGCSECHQPHAADQPNLLKRYYIDSFYASFDLNDYALCFSCHDKQLVLQPKTTTLTGFRDGQRNLHFLHVNRADKGRTCRTCHEVHGSDLPNHMASSVPFEGSNWAMPINYEQTADGGACTPGCHTRMTYRRGAETPPATRPESLPATTRGAP